MIDKIICVIPHDLIVVYSILFLLCGLGIFVGWYLIIYTKKNDQYEKAELFCNAFADAADIIFLRDSKGVILSSNKAHAVFLGCDPNDVIGKDSSELYPKEICDYLDEIDARIRLANKPQRFEMKLQNLKGSMIFCEVSLSPCYYGDIEAVLYILRDVHEQNRVINALVKRDKLLYALTCGTQNILNNSQDFERALSSALEAFGKGAGVEAVVLAQHVTTETYRGISRNDGNSYRVKNLWGDGDDLDNYKDQIFQIHSDSTLHDSVGDQDKILFVHVDKIKFEKSISLDNSGIIGFYVTTIFCNGIKWGLMLLACNDIKEKWDAEAEDAIEISALQFGLILERRQVEDSIEKTVVALKRSQKRLNMALKVAGAASFEYDIYLDKFDIDSTLYEKLGYDKTWEVSSLDELKKVIHKSDLDRWHDKVSALLNGDAYFITDDIRMRMQGGKYLWVTMMASTTIEDGAVCGLSGVFQDIDEKMIRESRLFNAEKMASIGELSTAIANRFNRVNRDVLKELNLLVGSYNSGECGNAEQIKNLITALEDSIIIADNLAALTPKDPKGIGMVGVNRLAESIIGMVRSDFGDSGIDIQTNYDLDIPDIICRATDLMHVIANLMINAKQAMELSEEKKLSISTSLDDDSILLSIKDTGCGIQIDRCNDIFQPFYSIKNNEENPDGTGLGLSVSLSLIKRYGGTIEVNSVVGEGSEFLVVLPRTSSSEALEDIIPLND